MDRSEVQAKIRVGFPLLTLREGEILSLRFGLNGRINTLQEIGEHFCVARERIRWIESRALRKIGIIKETGKGNWING